MFNIDVGRDYLRSYVCPVTKANPDEMNKLYLNMINEALDEFKVLNATREDLIIEKSVDVRYQRQFHELEIKFPEGDITTNNISAMEKQFHELHRELFTFSLPWVPVDMRNLRLIARMKAKKIEMQKVTSGSQDPSAAFKRKRACFFSGRLIETPIYDGTRLKAGNIIKGHAVIEDPTSTAVIPPGFLCTVDSYGNYVITK